MLSLMMSPFQFRHCLVALFVAAALVLMGAKVRAEEPAKYFLGEDGRVTKQEFSDLKKEVAELRKEVAALKGATAKAGQCPGGCVTAPGGVGTCGSYSCPANGGRGDCPCATAAAPAPAVTAPQVWYSYDGFPMRVSADGFHWERVPGATAQPSMVRVGNAIPASFTAPVCSGPGCSAPIPSYAPTYLPGYSLPSGVQSCPGGRCPTR